MLDEIIGLEFAIENCPDTEDSCEDEYMNLDMAVAERVLTLDRDELLRDYINTCSHSIKDCVKAAEKIVPALEMKLFEDCRRNSCKMISEEAPLLKEIKKRLRDDLENFEKEYAEKSRKGQGYWGEYQDSERIRRIKTLMEYFGE